MIWQLMNTELCINFDMISDKCDNVNEPNSDNNNKIIQFSHELTSDNFKDMALVVLKFI